MVLDILEEPYRYNGRVVVGLFIRWYYHQQDNESDYPANVFRHYSKMRRIWNVRVASYTSFYKYFYYLHKLGTLERTGRTTTVFRDRSREDGGLKVPDIGYLDETGDSTMGRSYYRVVEGKWEEPHWLNPQKWLFRPQEITPLHRNYHPPPLPDLSDSD